MTDELLNMANGNKFIAYTFGGMKQKCYLCAGKSSLTL